MGTRGVIRNVRRVGIMQRLHAMDLSAHCLEEGGWVHICLPMRYEPPERIQVGADFVVKPRMWPTPLGFQDPRKVEGELLWPEVYTEEKVKKMEVNLGTYYAAGQLQQRPTPRGGGMFKQEWFGILTQAPTCTRFLRYWDKAATAGGQGARSASVLIGEFQDASVVEKSPLRTKWIILDVKAARVGAAEREALIKQTADLDQQLYGFVSIWVEQEPGSGGKESAEFTVANLTGHYVQADKVSRAKDVRAEPLSAQASVGRVKLLAADWTRGFLDELGNFPLGKLKDQVDAAAGAFNKMWVPTGAFTSADGIYTGNRGFGDGESFRADRIGRGDM
jgi:phage terminase large subunit-like protein